MVYKRTKHWVKYHSDKCKMYLRNDFHFECAYCRMREQDNLAGEKIFEKDHFISKGTVSERDLDDYDNMVYACRICNRTKTDQKVDLILDPCEVDIYGGESPHIKKLGIEGQYRLQALTCQGQAFIDSLQLNSRFYRRMREKQAKHLMLRKEIHILLECLQTKGRQEMGENLEKLLKNGVFEDEGSDKFRCGISKAGDNLYSVIKILEEKQVEYKLVFNDHDLDVVLRYHDDTYYCEIKTSGYTGQNRRGPRVEKEKKKIWRNIGYPCGVLYYYKNMGILELYVYRDEVKTEKYMIT